MRIWLSDKAAQQFKKKEREEMSTATMEENETTVEEQDLELQPVDGDGDESPFEDEDDQEDGWLLLYVDGTQQIIPHPDGKKRSEIEQGYFEAKKKRLHAYRLGGWILDTDTIRAFGWADDTEFPEIERFDGLQNQLEALMAGTQALQQAAAELLDRQAMLQSAQEQLFQIELQEMERGEEDELDLKVVAGGDRPVPVVPAPPPAAPGKPVGVKVTRTGRKGRFKPPTAGSGPRG